MQAKVLYVARTTRGGSAFSLYHLVRALDRKRYEPIVLLYQWEHGYILDKLTSSDIKIITLEKHRQGDSPALAGQVRRRDIARELEKRFGNWSSQAYTFLKGCYEFLRWEAHRVWPIIRAIQDHDIDLVHVNAGLRGGKPGIIAAWLTRTPCICHVRMFDELTHFDKSFERCVTTFVYISKAVAGGYFAQGISPRNGIVVHNAVDLSEFPTNIDTTSVRKEFGWTSGECMVGIVGRLDWWKGHEYFLEAMAQVAEQVPSLRALIIGEAENTPRNYEYYQRLQALVRSLDLEDKVVFTGFRGDVPRLMSALNVIVLSSSSPEPFGRVVIDGMAAGRPVVATAAGGVLEIIEDGVNGLLVPPRDSKAIADAVLELLCNRAKAQEIGRAARRRVEEQFTLQRHVASIQQVYDTVLVNAGRSSANRKYQNANGAASLEILPGAESDDSREAIRTSCE
jgi:glycosyltransferase involved in cell wall biosynthesis